MQTVSRLIDRFIPEHYKLNLDLRRAERTFSGIVTINGSTPMGVNTMMVHAKDLTIESVTLDGKEASFSSGVDDELMITHPDLQTGRHIVVIAFHGAITDAMHGLYPCYYEHDGTKQELLATQFESHHAREVFPCIDEPAAKATFDVSLTTEQGVTVLGNMPILHQKVEDDVLVTSFGTSPRMSTYLLAWVVGALHKKTALTKRGIEVNVWATRAQASENLTFALDVATRTIDFFEEYFDTPYPLPKSDHVALPDFTSGAMENWGLVTYREIALLASSETSISRCHYIATVITHELSHQWFGNLVTMKWWNDLWLNESFATLMEYIAVDALYPDWDMWLDFATRESIMALRRDSIDGVQAVQVDVHHPDEIGTLFDGAIVYAKGARLLRMLQRYIGQDAFQAGLKAYFTAHAYGNTNADDLWRALSLSSSKDITTFMNTWIAQSGYPVVHVFKEAGQQLMLTQEQFFIGSHEVSRQLWPIPLNASSSKFPELLDSSKVVFSDDSATPVRLNVGDTAHFITHYETSLLKKVVDDMRAGNLTPLDRIQLLDEQTLLSQSGVVSSATLVPLLDAYRDETAESVWSIISMTLSGLKKFVETDEVAEKKLRKLSVSLARRQYERLGWVAEADEPETDTKLRATVIGMVLYGHDEGATKTAVDIYHSTRLEKLDPELRGLIISAAVRYSDDDTIVDTLLKRYQDTSSAELQQDIAAGLASSKDEKVLARLLGLIMDSSVVRSQDVTRWFVWIMRNRDGRLLAWQWLRGNWPWIEKTFGSDKSYDDYPRYSASMLVTRQQLDEYREFFLPMQNVLALERAVTIGVREIEGRVGLIERDGEAVCEALRHL
jgi:aminopeptidase N